MRNPNRVTSVAATAAFTISGVFTMSTLGFAADEDALGTFIPQQVTVIAQEEIDQ